MQVGAIPVGQLETNCYIVWDEAVMKGVVIDPGGEAGRILSFIQSEGINIEFILLTHGHFDHVMAVDKLRSETGAPVYIHPDESVKDGVSGFTLTGCLNYSEGDEITVGGMTLKVLSTPGHTPGCVVLLCGDYLFTGDTLFAGSCGRTDFPGGSWPKMLESLKRLHGLEGDYNVMPGHGDATTLDRERHSNMFMREALN